MKSRGTNAVYCEKPGSVRSNKPVCGIRRYKIDASGNTDWCLKLNGERAGYPNCIGGRRRSIRGSDQCVNAAVKKTSVRCPNGYALKGRTRSLNGRGSVHCYKARRTVVRRNTPVCGIHDYQVDAHGNTDWCTSTRNVRTGYPKCIGGTKRSIRGADQCVDIESERTTRPR